MSQRVDNNRPPSPVQRTESTPSPAAPARPRNQAATPAAGGDEDAFRGTTLNGQRRAFAGHFLGATPPASAPPATAGAAPAAPVAAVAPARTDEQVRAELGRTVDRALESVPGGLGEEARGFVRASVLRDAEAAAARAGVPLSALENVSIGFNVNGGLFTAGLSAQVFPLAQANTWSAAVGVSTPNRPGASISVGYGFRANAGLMRVGEGTAVNGRVSMGPMSLKAGTDGLVTVEHDLPMMSAGGGRASGGVEVSVPFQDLAATAREMGRQAERMTGDDPVALRRRADEITFEARGQSEARYREAQRTLNQEFDARARAASSPEHRALIDRERGQRLTDLMRQQNTHVEMLQRMNEQMLANIGRR